MKPVTDELLKDIVDRLVEALHPQEIYLFGSQAGSRTHQRSDVDILLVVDDDAGDRFDLSARGRRALRGIGVPIDLLVCRRSTMNKWAPVKFSLQYEATRKGKRVYAA